MKSRAKAVNPSSSITPSLADHRTFGQHINMLTVIGLWTGQVAKLAIVNR
jgi:hypothetical protein